MRLFQRKYCFRSKLRYDCSIMKVHFVSDFQRLVSKYTFFSVCDKVRSENRMRKGCVYEKRQERPKEKVYQAQ